VNTWAFVNATEAAYELLTDPTKSALDGVELGCSTCEEEQCDGSVGFGGSPDESSETTLDAMIMDGETMDVGSVGDVRRVKNAVKLARAVMDYTLHTLLVGDQLLQFAISMNFTTSNLSTPDSMALYNKWRQNQCQPNFRANVSPDPSSSCGPYTPNRLSGGKRQSKFTNRPRNLIHQHSHDTIAMIAIDLKGRMAVATSTNGASHKIPGRVGDSPIAGAGAYVDNDVGGCGATGDGDIMMRFLPCYQVVENMRNGMSPKDATEEAMQRIRRKHPIFLGSLVALNTAGEYGGASNGWPFYFAVRTANMSQVEVIEVLPPS